MRGAYARTASRHAPRHRQLRSVPTVQRERDEKGASALWESLMRCRCSSFRLYSNLDTCVCVLLSYELYTREG